MPQMKNVHIDAALSNLAIKYKQPEFVAEKVFPVVPVMKESDKYYIFRKEEMRDVSSLRRPGAKSNEISWDVDSATYSAEEYALSHLLPDRIVKNSDPAINPRINSVQRLLGKIRLGYERRVQALVQNHNLFTSSGSPTMLWNNDSITAFKIKKDINAAKKAVRQYTGADPNAILMNNEVADVLLAALASSATNTMYKEWLTLGKAPNEIWDMELIIGKANYLSNKEGQTDTPVAVWTDSVLVFYKERSPSLEALSLGYTFRVGKELVKSWRDEERGGEKIEASLIQDEKTVAETAAYLISNVLGA